MGYELLQLNTSGRSKNESTGIPTPSSNVVRSRITVYIRGAVLRRHAGGCTSSPGGRKNAKCQLD